MELWELIAREQIRELVAGYAHAADGGRFDTMVELFAPDGVLQTPDGVEHRGRDGIRSFLDATRKALAGEARPGAMIRHHVANLLLERVGPSEASGAAYFLVVTDHGPDHWGRYRDRYACLDGTWRFAHRRVRLDGRLK